MKAIRNFDLAGFLGFWYVVQYYASSEEAPVYGCMRSMFSMEEDNHVSVFYIYVRTCISFTIHKFVVSKFEHFLILLNAVIEVNIFDFSQVLSKVDILYMINMLNFSRVFFSYYW